ncbi:Hypothetical predicted protein [Mytilus galloprovincialis]|uniref:TRPM SLOG domain-containing protein n=1 Tax=Mytilus galloprovincialis TaxID=29158 RepID=A0A8B6GB33_MYTGA|nr:Hypothetical predicted protein [Mytilus galloprovincialis]
MGDMSRVLQHEIIEINVAVEKGSKKNTRKKLNEEIKTTDLYDNKWQLEVYDKGRPQKTEIIWEELTKNKNKYPGLVLAVVGDCDSYVPKPWNTTAFTTGLVNTVNGVENSWIIYRGKSSGVSAYIDKTFKKETRQNGNVLIVVQPIKNHNYKGEKHTTEHSAKEQKIEHIGEGKQSKEYDEERGNQIQTDIEEKMPTEEEIQITRINTDTNTNDPEKLKIFQIHPENKDLSEGHKWFNTYMSKLLSQISKRWTPLLSFEDKDKKKDKALDENNDNEKDKNKKKDNTTSKQDLEMKVPVLLVVVEGDTRTIHQVKAAVKKNIPVLLIKGSGNAADLISDYLNEPIHSERDRLLKNQAPLLFGTCFLGNSFLELIKMMEKIAKFNHLITVYDVDNTSGFKMEDAVVEAIIKGWSLRDLNKNIGIEDSDSEENVPVITTPEDTKEEIEQPPKQNTVTLNIVKDNNFDTSLMKNYQLTLTPGSLSLFFYIAYQFIQEKEYERKKEDLQLLLLEAIIANRVEYVSVMLQNGVEFDPTHFDKLYNETLKCENCKAKDCRKIHSIHYRISDVVCEQIWSTCDENICKNDAKILCKRHRKGDLCKKHLEDEWESSRIRHYGKLMCQQLLNYATITRDNRSCIQCKVHPTKDGAGDKGADALCEECKEHPKEDCNEGYFSDLLAWALFTNRVQLAGVFWSKCKNQLLTAVMASSLLKNMAENASSAKDRQLHQELLDHSRLFEERVIYMQTALYEECEYKAMLLMEEY